MAICRGATAIGYFTHIWKPSYSQFGVPQENRDALARINAQITRLAPAILGREPARTVSFGSEGTAKVDVLPRETEGKDLYVFAVNYDESLKEAVLTVSIEGLAEGAAVEVVDEGREVRADQGSFADRFAPLAVHVYRVRM